MAQLSDRMMFRKAFGWDLVLTVDQNNPPESNHEGDWHVRGDAVQPGSPWEKFAAGTILRFVAGVWAPKSPTQGDVVFCLADDTAYCFDGRDWRKVARLPGLRSFES